MQEAVDAKRQTLCEGDWMSKMGLHQGWAARLHKAWPGRFESSESFAGVLTLEMVRTVTFVTLIQYFNAQVF